LAWNLYYVCWLGKHAAWYFIGLAHPNLDCIFANRCR